MLGYIALLGFVFQRGASTKTIGLKFLFLFSVIWAALLLDIREALQE